MSDIHLDPRLGLAAGTVLGGRYAVLAVGDGGRFTADDLARPGKKVAGVAWICDRDRIDLEAARLARIGSLAHEALAPLGDFGRIDASDVVFAVSEPLSAGDRAIAPLAVGSAAPGPLAPAVLAGIDPARALRDLLGLAVRLTELDLPPLALAPSLLVPSGPIGPSGPSGLALSALDLALAPAAGTPASVAALAELLVTSTRPAPPLRRVLQRFRAAPGLDPARALAELVARDLVPPPRPGPHRPALHSTELALLERKLRDLVEAGRGGVAAVIGPAGSGKSAILERFRWSVRRSLVTLLEALCGDCPGTLGPLTALVRQLVGFAPPAYLWRHARDLAPFAPALTGGVTPPTPLVDSEARRGRLVESVLRLVREVAVARPLVLRFADLHRADPASIALLCALATELARRPEGLGCLLLLEARTGDATPDATQATLAALRNSDGYTEIHVSPPPPVPAAADPRAAPPEPPLEGRLDRARHLAERGETEEALETLARLEEMPLTSGLAARLGALRASVMLRRGDTALAAEHAEAARKQLLRGRRDPMLVLALIEAEQVLGAIALDQGDLERALRLETSALERCDEGAAPHRRVASLVRVGNVRFARGELDLALAAYEKAAGLATTHDDTLGLAEALLNRGTLRFKQRRLGDARADLEQSLALRERLGDTTGAAATLSSLSLIDASEARFDAGRDRLARARETLGRAGDIANLALAELSAGILEADAGSFPDSVRALRRAADLAQSRGDRRLEATARAFLAESLARQGEAADATTEAVEALALARALGSREPLGLALRAFAVAAMGQASPAAVASPGEIERHLRESLLIFERASNESEARRTRARLEEYLAQSRPAPPDEAAETDAAASPAADPGLLSGDVETDRRNLKLLAATLAADRSAGEQAALARLSEAAVARFAVLVQLTAREHGVATLVLSSHGKPVASVIEAALEAASAHFAGRTGPPGPARIAISSRATALVVPLRLPGAGTLPSGFVLLALRPHSAAAPFAILEALARPLRAVLQRADLSRPERRLRAHGDGFGGIVGRTPVMRKLFSLLDRVMANELPVLLQGESGTGKELVARAIHDGSPRRDRPFVPIDCAAIPESLIESELFGHCRGAFTGTTSDRIGLFEEANGGTVFLDEVTNIPPPVQAKLLRVLQEREVRRVGDTQLRSIDVRVIAATNRPLEAAVREGAFREDLFFRLRVIEIILPPLRERIEDLPLLADHFLGRLGDPPPRIERSALDRLLGYDWPGNVRELENELRRALALARGGVLRESDLSRLFFESRPSALAMGEVPRLHEAVAALERELVERALRLTGYHRAKTAQLLGLSHQGLINKIRKYRIRASPRRKNDQRS